MRRFYSDEDVARWKTAYGQTLDIHQGKLATEFSQEGIDFHLGGIAGTHHMLGMMFIAQGNFAKAIQSFRSGVEARDKMYDRFERGQGRSLDAGHFQTLLVAFATKDEALISRFAAHFRVDEGTPGSVYLGKAVKHLALLEIDAAKIALAEKKPRFESQFVGYAECLKAIANKDQQGFVSALDVATKSWAIFASRTVKGLPDSVCFIQGIGLVRLAERVLGNPIHIANEHMPQELLR